MRSWTWYSPMLGSFAFPERKTTYVNATLVRRVTKQVNENHTYSNDQIICMEIHDKSSLKKGFRGGHISRQLSLTYPRMLWTARESNQDHPVTDEIMRYYCAPVGNPTIARITKPQLSEPHISAQRGFIVGKPRSAGGTVICGAT